MSEKVNPSKIQSQQIKNQQTHLPVKKTQIDQQNDKTQASKINLQSNVMNSKKEDSKNRKIDSKGLGLVLYEVAKTNQSVFTEEQKYPLIASLGGVFLTLLSASLINVSQSISKTYQKRKKLFLTISMANIFASLCLGGFSIYKMSDMYVKILEEKWSQIAKEKQAYDKLSYSQKKAFMLKNIEEEEKQLKQALPQTQLLTKQEKIDLTK